MNIPSPLYTSPHPCEREACIKTVLVAISFHYRELRPVGKGPARVALLPGAWNPPTIAHVAMARAALSWADEVVLILPRALPHKEFEGVTFHDRVALLTAVAAARRFSAATADRGLYVEMANDATEYFGEGTEVGLVCGRDAAERIASWDYGRPGVFDEMLTRYPLLVAGRAGEYRAAPAHAGKVVDLPLGDSFNEVSSTEIRRRIAAGEEWRSLVPGEIAEAVERLYRHQGK